MSEGEEAARPRNNSPLGPGVSSSLPEIQCAITDSCLAPLPIVPTDQTSASESAATATRLAAGLASTRHLGVQPLRSAGRRDAEAVPQTCASAKAIPAATTAPATGLPRRPSMGSILAIFAPRCGPRQGSAVARCRGQQREQALRVGGRGRLVLVLEVAVDAHVL